MPHLRSILCAAALLGLAGCTDAPSRSTSGGNALFAARDAKLHPVFTKISDWDADGRVDGVEALVELHDQFGDPTKGAGTFTFELDAFKPGQPDPRGNRISNPWQVEVITAEQQEARWSRTSRCYSFRLAADRVNRQGSYVLSVTFAPADGGPRSFDRIVLAGAPVAPTDATTPPTPPANTPAGPPSPGPSGTIDSLPR